MSSGKVALKPIELKELTGRVEGRRCLHPMCHIGTDTLSLKHAGASCVVGLDFSGPALAHAARLAEAARLEGDAARWVESDVYSAPEALKGEVFDLVISTVGTLCWLPSVRDYARVVAQCLAPGGTFYIHDSHPMLMALADDATPGYTDRPKDAAGGRELLVAYPYFETAESNVFDDSGTYADASAVIENTRTHEWNHPLGDIVTSLIEAGLVLEFLHEHKELGWQFLDTMEPAGAEGGEFRLPPHQQDWVPCMFSLRAFKPLA